MLAKINEIIILLI